MIRFLRKLSEIEREVEDNSKEFNLELDKLREESLRTSEQLSRNFDELQSILDMIKADYRTEEAKKEIKCINSPSKG